MVKSSEDKRASSSHTVVRGQIVRSLAGHDKGDFQTVLEVCVPYAIVCDGKRRSLEKPKRKKLMHMAPTSTVLEEETLTTNRKIRNALKSFIEKDNALLE